MDLLSDRSIRRVALVRLRVGLGDLLCSVPMVRALRRARPDLHIALVTWPEVQPVVSRIGRYVDTLLPFPGVPGIPERDPRPRGWEPFLRGARRMGFDVAVQCYGDNARANDVTAALGARLIAGFAPDGWTAPRDTELHLPYPTDAHEVWRLLHLVGRLGVPLTDGDGAMEFAVTPQEERALDTLLRRYRLSRGAYVVLHAGASASTRRWPAERFAAVGDEIAARGLRVVLTGVERERAVSDRVTGAMVTRPVDLTGRTGLGLLAALVRDSAALVGNDTGTAHLAAAVGTPTVTLFLSGDPTRWAHPGPEHRAVWADVGCNPCPHLRCPIDHPCAVSITPSQVTAELARALSAARRTSEPP